MEKPNLSGISEDIVSRMIKYGVKRKFREGTRIFAQGEKAEFLPTVLSGRVKMVRFPEPGKEVIIGTFGPGEIFAIPPALDGKAFPSTAIAMEDTELLVLGREHFLDLLSYSTDFSSIIMQRVCGILRDRSDTIHVLAKQSAEQRIAKLLASLVEKEDVVFPYRVGLRRQDIAEMSGLTLEATIRTIRKMADKGLFDISRGKIVINNKRDLDRVSDA
ncbi:MAG: Crp/Fnr family transcriptional regulator [Pyrinomonadaceae bacterium]|nr:Crp/Fnr family transcriptional regulator [Pyrinomonadaceae bacterium]